MSLDPLELELKVVERLELTPCLLQMQQVLSTSEPASNQKRGACNLENNSLLRTNYYSGERILLLVMFQLTLQLFNNLASV